MTSVWPTTTVAGVNHCHCSLKLTSSAVGTDTREHAMVNPDCSHILNEEQDKLVKL